MTVKEITDKLREFPDDLECLIAINQSAGFEDYDHLDVYPVEKVFMQSILESEPKAIGYWHGDDGEKVLFYVFP